MLALVTASEVSWACCNGWAISRMLPVHQRPFFVVLRVVVQIRESGVVAHLATYITAHNPFKLLQAVYILQAGLHTRIMFTDNLAKAELISLLSCHAAH